jgi:hypothetical protein
MFFRIVNFLLIPPALNALTYIVFFSKYRLAYELLTFGEKIKYVTYFGMKLSIISSIMFLPIFSNLNDKKRITNKFHF